MRISFTQSTAVMIGLLWLVVPLQAQTVDADNVRDYDENNNAIAPGRWAYGWFGGGGIEDQKKDLLLISQAFPQSRLNIPHWSVDSKKKELCWIMASDGRVWTDHAAMAWIYQVPEKLAGSIRFLGTATSRAASKRLRVYLFEGKYFQGKADRVGIKPVFEETGKDISIDMTVEASKDYLLLFVQDDTGNPPRFSDAQKLQNKLSKP